jgi:sulfate adenylyltransferase
MQRGTKGMYAKARRGEIRDFTGLDDPYEAPLHPELTLDTVSYTPEENARLILDYLIERGFVQVDTRVEACIGEHNGF